MAKVGPSEDDYRADLLDPRLDGYGGGQRSHPGALGLPQIRRTKPSPLGRSPRAREAAAGGLQEKEQCDVDTDNGGRLKQTGRERHMSGDYAICAFRIITGIHFMFIWCT